MPIHLDECTKAQLFIDIEEAKDATCEEILLARPHLHCTGNKDVQPGKERITASRNRHQHLKARKEKDPGKHWKTYAQVRRQFGSLRKPHDIVLSDDADPPICLLKKTTALQS